MIIKASFIKGIINMSDPAEAMWFLEVPGEPGIWVDTTNTKRILTLISEALTKHQPTKD